MQAEAARERKAVAKDEAKKKASKGGSEDSWHAVPGQCLCLSNDATALQNKIQVSVFCHS
jgi:hypothetical protein